MITTFWETLEMSVKLTASTNTYELDQKVKAVSGHGRKTIMSCLGQPQCAN